MTLAWKFLRMGIYYLYESVMKPAVVRRRERGVMYVATVTQVVKDVKQPRGGYIPPKKLLAVTLSGDELKYSSDDENIHASLVGLAVDYLTRFMNGAAVEDAFGISLRGARNAREEENARKLIQDIQGLDEPSIRSACKLVGYDVCYRVGMIGFNPVSTINPNEATIQNITCMVERSLAFFKQYGPITKDGFDLEGAYTDKVTKGDGDFLTRDTLWDFKVSKTKPTSKHTLQIIIYYLMGKRSVHEEFETVTHIGLFNPRQNVVYTLAVDEVDSEIIADINQNVIGYV